jgi:hypothetical protein
MPTGYLQQQLQPGSFNLAGQLFVQPGGSIGSVSGTGNGLVLVNGGSSSGAPISGTTTPGTTTTTATPVIQQTTGNPASTTTPTTTTNTTSQQANAAPVSPAKVWYQDWKTWAIAGVAIAAVYYMYLKATKK